MYVNSVLCSAKVKSVFACTDSVWVKYMVWTLMNAGLNFDGLKFIYISMII